MKKRNTLSDFLKKYYNCMDSSNVQEKWKDILLGDVVIYQISNLGRVRRKDTKYVINPFHSYRKDADGKYILTRPTYLRVQLYYYENKVRKVKKFEISRLVALYFIPIPKKYVEIGLSANDLEVNHIRGGYEIYNNTVSNLEWTTSKENVEKSVETGLRHSPKGSKHHSTKINESDVIEICECISKGIGVKDAFNLVSFIGKYNLSYKQFKWTYYNIKYKVSWTFISQHFDF